MSQLSAAVRELRVKAGYSQRALAEKLGVTFTYISKIENDKTEYPPSETVLRRLAPLLDVGEDWLIFKAGKIPSPYVGLLEELALKFGEQLPERLEQLLSKS